MGGYLAEADPDISGGEFGVGEGQSVVVLASYQL